MQWIAETDLPITVVETPDGELPPRYLTRFVFEDSEGTARPLTDLTTRVSLVGHGFVSSIDGNELVRPPSLHNRLPQRRCQ